MKAIKFKESNVVFAENQEDYKSLPAMYDSTTVEGIVVTCYQLSFIERLRALFRGRIWLALMTFNNPLQPQFLTTKKSEILTTKKSEIINQNKKQ